jgi:hypothetical protein
MSSGSMRTPNAASRSWRTSTVPAGSPRCSASGSADSSGPRTPVSSAQARWVAAKARALPHAPVTVKLDSPTAARFAALATRYGASPRDLVAVAVYRFLTAPGDYRHTLINEAGAAGLDEKFTASIRPSARRDIERLADRHGTRLASALVRVAVRRLLDNPADLTGDLETRCRPPDVAMVNRRRG